LTPWNVLEYKGPTESARFDELHDLLELGLGIHRRLNDLQRKEKLAQLDYPETSFWYLVNHLGSRFLADLPQYLPGVQQVTDGLWQAAVFRHPVFLVSVRELAVERDSLPLHVLAGVPEQARNTVASVVAADRALQNTYAGWLFVNEPLIWEEVLRMAGQQEKEAVLSLRGLVDLLRLHPGCQVTDFKEFVEAYGLKQAVEAVGTEEFWAGLSPEQRADLRRLAERDAPPNAGDQK
jgi:hypothetical protein